MKTLWRGNLGIGLIALCVALIGANYDAQAQSPATTFQNPVINANFPDPFILKAEDGYYAYSTNATSRNVPTAFSTNLVDWEMRRDAMPALAKWVRISRADVWAPEVIQIGSQYVLYYTARDKASGKQCIGAATGGSPSGPFRDRSETALVCQTKQGGSIDASPFRDTDETLYLYWKNDGNCCNLSTHIFVQQLAPDGLSLVGEATDLIRNDEPWEGSVVEAPTMFLHDNRYYLFYSGNMFATEKYAVGYATCEKATGPCKDAAENPILASDMKNKPLVVGPGHQTLLADESGQTWIFYHIWQVTASGQLTGNRQVWMDRITWVDGHPKVEGPTRSSQPGPVTTPITGRFFAR